MSNKNPVKAGWEIAPLAYDSPRHLLIPEEANLLVDGHNRIHRMEIVRGSQDRVVISDHKITIELRDSALDRASDGNAPFHINTPNQGTADFKDITVNNGYLSFFGTTQANKIPGTVAGPWLNGTNAPTALTVDSAAIVYVYLYYTGGGWIITSASADDATWITFGVNDNKHIIIGIIDSTTDAATNELIVTQLYEGNLYLPVNGIVNAVDYRPVLVFDSVGSGNEVPNHSMVRGLFAGGFPADGLYLYIGGGGGIGPGGNYQLLASD